jgi:hypothetical protein
MDRVFLAWNITNWITVILMGALGYVLFAIISQAYQNFAGRNSGVTG